MIKKIITEVKNTGIPIRYRVFKEKPSIPFIVYYEEESVNYIADGKVYATNTEYALELYSEKKEYTIEKQIEDIFDNFEIAWEKEEEYIDSEKLIEIIYYFGVKGE